MKKLLVSLASTTMMFGAANAALVAQGATAVGDGAGIVLTSGGSSVASNNSLYDQSVTVPASDWVWTDNGDQSTTYTFTFDLTGFDITTAELTGLWGVDNTGTATLNGNGIANLPNVTISNFSSLHAYSTDVDSDFIMGVNTLVFQLADAGGPEAFRATAIVNADRMADPVPVPAALPLFAAGIAGFAGLKHRKKK